MNLRPGATVNERKQHGTALLQAGHVSEARQVFEALSRDARRDAAVWHLLGACHGLLGDNALCEACERKAVELSPAFAGAWANLGTALFGQGKLAEAETALLEALRHAPTDAQALNNLGNVYREMKKHDEAGKCYREALRVQPDYPDALTNLGLIMQDRGEHSEAANLHRRALTFNPQHVDAHYNLGYVLMLMADEKSAIPIFERLTQLRPDQTRGWVSLGSAYARVHDHHRAVQQFEQSLRLEPDNAENLATLGACYLAIAENDKSIMALSRALELDPGNAETRYWLAAAGVGETPKKASAEAVAKLFDGYAGNFDEHLVGKLQYRTPALIGDSLRRARGDDAGKITILDIGCGTGLLGIEIRDMADRLTGVDLSPKMIEQARKRGNYDELAVQDIVTFMEGRSRQYDAVLSADVFVYIGALESVFASVAGCLRETGFFVFSVEAHLGDEHFYLRSSGRFAHSLPYLRDLAARHGFEEISVDNTTIRLERGAPIEGHVMALRLRNPHPPLQACHPK